MRKAQPGDSRQSHLCPERFPHKLVKYGLLRQSGPGILRLACTRKEVRTALRKYLQ